MPETKQTRIPAPLYAAAGASDLAYQQLRKLPGKVAKLRGRAEELRPVVSDKVADLTARAELERLREAARRNAAVFMTGAQVAQNRAAAVYTDLVTRGERVVNGARDEAAAELKSAADTVVDAAAGLESAADTVAATEPAAGEAVTQPLVAEPTTASTAGKAAPQGVRRSTPRKGTAPAAE